MRVLYINDGARINEKFLQQHESGVWRAEHRFGVHAESQLLLEPPGADGVALRNAFVKLHLRCL